MFLYYIQYCASCSIIFPQLTIGFFLEYEDIVNVGIDCGVGQPLEPGGGSKFNATADTQYKE